MDSWQAVLAQARLLKEQAVLAKILIQFWEASIKIVEGGSKYYELKTSDNPIDYIPWDDGGGLAAYRKYSLACSITIQQGSNKLNGQHSEGVISRVFRTKRSEMSPNISYYSIHEYPDKDLALSFGIRLSLCFPVYKTVDHFSRPDGVLEFVSTCDLDLDRQVNQYFEYHFFSLRKRGFYLSGYHLSSSILQQLSLGYSPLEMDHVLKLLCQSFQLPLVQYWVTGLNLGALSVIYQKSDADFENLKPWCELKKACLHRGLKIGEGLVGKTCISHKSLFCMDISEFSITDHPLVHYVRNCGSMACFTIFLCSFLPPYRECVLEFFLPAQKRDNYYPLLDSLLATMKVHLQYYTVASGEQLGQLLSVDVVNYSIHDESKIFKVGQPQSNLPQPEGSENEEDDASQQLPCLQLLFKGSTEQDKHIIDLEKSNSNINSDEETSSGETSNRTPNNVPEIIHLDYLEEPSHIKCIEPHSLASQPMKSKEILEDEGTTVDVDHSALKMILEEAIQHKERVDEMTEESPSEDVGYPMTTTSPPSSFQTMKSLPQQKVKEATMVLDTSAQKLIVLEDVHQIPNNGIILGVEKDDTTIHSATKTFVGNTLEREKQYIKDISIESLSEHFGRPLDDAAKSFGVSRATFKRKLRGLGIPRWQRGKRKLDEEPHRRGIPPVQDSVVAQASQGLNKMTVKATYNGVTIRFELAGVSGIAELEQNVIERLHLERESFSIKYQDDEGDWILIACDKDVRECMEVSRSLKKTTIRILLDPPVNHYAP